MNPFVDDQEEGSFPVPKDFMGCVIPTRLVPEFEAWVQANLEHEGRVILTTDGAKLVHPDGTQTDYDLSQHMADTPVIRGPGP